jgi:hypothetical protein
MASASHTLTDFLDATLDVDLVSQTLEGAVYRLSSRSFAEPFSLEFVNKIGAPGSNGNDKVTVLLRNTNSNTTTGKLYTSTAKLELSIPRDSDWDDASSKDMLARVINLMSDANIALVIDAMVP